jgi:hypothetical protein
MSEVREPIDTEIAAAELTDMELDTVCGGQSLGYTGGPAVAINVSSQSNSAATGANLR